MRRLGVSESLTQGPPWRKGTEKMALWGRKIQNG